MIIFLSFKFDQFDFDNCKKKIKLNHQLIDLNQITFQGEVCHFVLALYKGIPKKSKPYHWRSYSRGFGNLIFSWWIPLAIFSLPHNSIFVFRFFHYPNISLNQPSVLTDQRNWWFVQVFEFNEAGIKNYRCSQRYRVHSKCW